MTVLIRERARVLEPFPGGAWVAVEGREDCARCAAGQGCGASTLARVLGDRLSRVEVTSESPLAAGATVELGIDPRVISLAAALVYGVPLLALFAGALVGTGVGSGLGADADAAIGGIGGLALGLAASRRIARGLAPRGLRPRVIRALAADAPCGR